MKNIFLISLFIFHTVTWSQDYRYTSNLFSDTSSILNVTYGIAPAVNGPFYTVESSTTNQNLLMNIYSPVGDTFQLRPAIVFAHSGGFLLGNKEADDMIALCEYFAKKGYVTVAMGYRKGFNLLQNVSLHSTRAVYRGLQDGRSAVRYMRANASLYGVDSSKIYFVGSSAGSFIALHSIYINEASEIPTEAGTNNYINITPPFIHTAPSLGLIDLGSNLSFSGKPDAVVSMWGAVQSTNLITTNDTTPILLMHGEADPYVSFNTASPFNFPSIPQTDGSNPINAKLDLLGFTNKETYFVTGQGHEFYGTTNGTWNNGTGGNSYWPIITGRITQFLWKQHKPTVDYSWSTNNLSVAFTDTSSGSIAWWWDFGDGSFSNEQNPTHIYTTDGNYQVKLYIENNIKSWDEIIKTVVVSNLSLSDNEKNNFLVIPNPTNSIINVKWNVNFNFINYQIKDNVGKIIRTGFLNETNNEISLDSFSNGLYFLKVSTENTNQIIKIIKQ